MARNLFIAWAKALLAVAILIGGTYSASAQYRFCVDRIIMVEQLTQKFQEKQFAVGTMGPHAVMEIFVGDEGTWTVVITDVTGQSCMIAAGKDWASNAFVAGTDS